MASRLLRVLGDAYSWFFVFGLVVAGSRRLMRTYSDQGFALLDLDWLFGPALGALFLLTAAAAALGVGWFGVASVAHRRGVAVETARLSWISLIFFVASGVWVYVLAFSGVSAATSGDASGLMDVGLPVSLVLVTLAALTLLAAAITVAAARRSE